VAGAFFMENLDGTIIATAAPKMAQSFDVAPVELNVVITAYLLTLAVLIPVSGWVADRVGARTVFAVAIVVFTAASGLCALSTGLHELTATRVLQGAGGAMMVPVGRLVVLRSTDRADLIDAIAYLTWPALAAPLVAPALGGALATYASWRWIFVINLPLGLVALIVALRIVPNVRETSSTPLDWAGFALTGVGLGALVLGLEPLTGSHVSWSTVTVLLTVSVGSLALAVRHLRRSRHPLLNLAYLRIPTFRLAMLGGSLFRLAIGAVPFLLPLMFQTEFGWSPVKSGLVVIAVFCGNIVVKPLTGPLLRRYGFRTLLLATGAASSVTLALCALVTASTPLVLVVPLLFVSGALRSVGFTAYNTIAFADVAPIEMGQANTLAATTQQLTMGLGVALGALAVRAGGPVSSLIGVSRTGHGPFAVAFVLIGVVAGLAVIDTALVPTGSGSALTGT
jgi:EmrB/QacA subfamily drug resistance transporter